MRPLKILEPFFLNLCGNKPKKVLFLAYSFYLCILSWYGSMITLGEKNYTPNLLKKFKQTFVILHMLSTFFCKSHIRNRLLQWIFSSSFRSHHTFGAAVRFSTQPFSPSYPIPQHLWTLALSPGACAIESSCLIVSLPSSSQEPHENHRLICQ